VTSLRKLLRTRRGGGRVVQGGDACVALAGGGKRAQDEGDATAQGVPSPHNPSPAPTGKKPLLKAIGTFPDGS